MVVAGLFFIALLAVVSSASPMQKRQEAHVISSCNTAKTVALTFDDGPWIYLQDVVNTLNAAGAIGTFFFNGNNYACIYDDDSVTRVKYAYQHGHQIGEHTWSHADLTKLSPDQIHNEMWRIEQALQKIIGVLPAFMRPPYGNYNSQVLQVALQRNQSVAMWDLDTGDSVGASPAQSKASYDNAIAKHPSNILALNHETMEPTAHQVLPYAIKQLQTAGYRLVSLAECVGMSPYQSVGAPSARDSTWTC